MSILGIVNEVTSEVFSATLAALLAFHSESNPHCPHCMLYITFICMANALAVEQFTLSLWVTWTVLDVFQYVL